MGWNHQLDKDNHTPKLIFGVPCLWVSIWIMLFNLIFQKQLLKGSLTIERVFGKTNISGTTNVKRSFRKKKCTSPYLNQLMYTDTILGNPFVFCVLCQLNTCFLVGFFGPIHPFSPPTPPYQFCCPARQSAKRDVLDQRRHSREGA